MRNILIFLLIILFFVSAISLTGHASNYNYNLYYIIKQTNDTRTYVPDELINARLFLNNFIKDSYSVNETNRSLLFYISSYNGTGQCIILAKEAHLNVTILQNSNYIIINTTLTEPIYICTSSIKIKYV